MILHTEFALIWTTPWSDEKDLFLILVIRDIRKFPYEKLTFFLGKLSQKLFVLHSNYTGDTPYRVWFDLDNSVVRWTRPIFKIGYSVNTQISVWNTNFFPRQPIARILFVLHSNYTGDTPYRVEFDLDNSLVQWKRPIFKIGYSGNTQISVWKTYFFPRQAISKILCFTL